VLALQRTAGNRAVARLLADRRGQGVTRADRQALQREMKFELQTSNPIWRTRGSRSEKLPRKFGPGDFLHQGAQGRPATRRREGTAIELQSESGGFVEFETPRWFSNWCGLKRRIQEAVDMVEAIKAAPKVGTSADGFDLVEFPFDVSRLRKTKRFPRGLRRGEKLQVEIRDPTWTAKIQSSEAFELSQYESFMDEHARASWAAEAKAKADELLTEANVNRVPAAELRNLRNFLLIVITYIQRGQHDWGYSERQAAKEYLSLMARTSFSSMYRELLSRREKRLFDGIVSRRAILDKMSLTRRSLFYAHGVQGPLRKLTVDAWLQSIPKKGRLRAGREETRSQKDRLSLPAGGSRAMGRFDVETRPDEDDTMLVRFETRGTIKGPSRRLEEWVSYAKERFRQAFLKRNRPGKSTELEFDPADCP
jgi:hypothetical protein